MVTLAGPSYLVLLVHVAAAEVMQRLFNWPGGSQITSFTCLAPLLHGPKGWVHLGLSTRAVSHVLSSVTVLG